MKAFPAKRSTTAVKHTYIVICSIPPVYVGVRCRHIRVRAVNRKDAKSIVESCYPLCTIQRIIKSN